MSIAYLCDPKETCGWPLGWAILGGRLQRRNVRPGAWGRVVARQMGFRARVLMAAVVPVTVSAIVLVARGHVPLVGVVDALLVGLMVGAGMALSLVNGQLRSITRLRISTRRIALDSGGDAPPEKGGIDDLDQLAAWLSAVSRHVRRSLREAREREQETEAVFARMADGILLVDGDLRIRRLNPAAAEMLALTPGRALGYTVIEATMLHSLDGLFREAMLAGATRMRRLETIQPRRRLLHVLVTPLEGGVRGSGAVAVLQDLTEFDRVERVRRDFVTNVSHELRTPVTSIKVMVESLQRGAIKQKALREEFFRSIVEATDRLAQLVDDVLALARIEAGPGRLEWQPVALDQLVRETVAAQVPLAREYQVELTAETDEPLVVTGDPEGLRQAIANLITNGVKYNHPGGQVHIRLRRTEEEACLEVADTGIGIPPEHLSRIFERFYRVDRGRSRELGGTGLGLAIVKHVCEAHGGQVRVESVVGKGSTFQMTLPLTEAAPAPLSDRATDH